VVTHADGFGERAAALAMLDAMPANGPRRWARTRPMTRATSLRACRDRGVTPHVAVNDTHQGGSAIDGRTTRHAGYGLSQVVRKRIEEHFGWGKTVGRFARRSTEASGASISTSSSR
jgi:hypothetical protein